MERERERERERFELGEKSERKRKRESHQTAALERQGAAQCQASYAETSSPATALALWRHDTLGATLG